MLHSRSIVTSLLEKIFHTTLDVYRMFLGRQEQESFHDIFLLIEDCLLNPLLDNGLNTRALKTKNANYI